MRKTLFSLLILAAGTAFGAAQVRPQSPVLFPTLLTSSIACTQGINQARLIVEPTQATRYDWKVDNGIIVDGQNTSEIRFTPINTGYMVLSVHAFSFGNETGAQITLPVFDPPTIVRQPRSQTVLAGTSAVLSIEATDDAWFFDWYEGQPGDMSKVVLPGATVFRTPRLTKTTSYWVRVN